MVQGDVLRMVPTERYVYLNSLRLAPRLHGQAAAPELNESLARSGPANERLTGHRLDVRGYPRETGR